MKKIINELNFKKLTYAMIILASVGISIFIASKISRNSELIKIGKSNLNGTDSALMKTLNNSQKDEITKLNALALENNRVDLENLEFKTIEIANITEASEEKTITSRASTETRKSLENEKSDEKQKTTTSEENESKEAKSKEKYTSISEVKISKTMDLTKRTGLSRTDFIKLISEVKQDTSGFFEENAGTIYDLCKKYSINEIFFCGLISAESGWNIASNHRSTHNYISLMSNGKLIKYSSVNEGLEVAAQKLHNNYLTPGGKFYHGKTLSAVKTNFCPSSSTWVDLVYGRMKQIV